MSPEQKAQRAGTHSQSIIDNLRKAVNAGAMEAQFDNGKFLIYPDKIPDKDLFEDQVKTYTKGLLGQKVDRKSAIGNGKAIRDRFHAGTAAQQFEISNNLSNAVSGLSRAIATSSGR